jgi:hypothetical protein
VRQGREIAGSGAVRGSCPRRVTEPQAQETHLGALSRTTPEVAETLVPGAAHWL